MSGRSQKILNRFPAHLEAARSGKRLGEVAEALADDLDSMSVAAGRVRKSRRLSDAEELRDLFRLAGLFGMRQAEFAVLVRRFAVARALLQPAEGTDEDAVRLGNLWGIEAPGFTLNRYAAGSPPDAQAARAALAAHARASLNYGTLLDAVRQRIATAASIHAQGNGTVRAMARAAANALDCDVESIADSEDRYIHRAAVRDRLRLSYPAGNQTAFFSPAREEVVLEENPLERVTTGAESHKHADLFTTIRRGFERTALEVRITGIQDGTVGPMFVNRDEGHGLGYSGSVPNGSTLVFTEEGRALLDGQDVTSRAYAWQGACFAEELATDKRDFVFDQPGKDGGQAAHFAQEFPAGSLGGAFLFPHAGDSLPAAAIDVGENRFAFFVQVGFYSFEAPGGSVIPVEPRPSVAFLDGSVFAPAEGGERPDAGLIQLSWLERCAFRVRIWIEKRFARLTPEDPDGRATRQQVADAVERFRPAGVKVDVDFLDNRWVLGRGVALASDGAPTVLGPGTGMELWSAEEG